MYRDDATTRARVKMKPPFHADDNRNQRQDDQNAAQLPDERLPGRDRRAGPRSDQLVEALVAAEQYRQRQEQRPAWPQPARHERAPSTRRVLRRTASVGGV